MTGPHVKNALSLARAWISHLSTVQAPLLCGLASVLAMIALLRAQGRLWWCASGDARLWSGDAWGPHNSQHLFDPYSLTHLLHGIILCGLLTMLAPRLTGAWRLSLTVALECLWEVLENAEAIIERYRAATAAVGYVGDSIANSVGDVLFCIAGFWIASRLGLWRSAVLTMMVEVMLLVTIRDSLFLNVLMLGWPQEWIRRWQSGA